jgi:hypothetical protein
MIDEAPVRKHVNISARDSAQLELRLHWFARALAERQGYIVALLRRANARGRQVATVAYELQLPRVVLPASPARRRRVAARAGELQRAAGGRTAHLADRAASGAL